MPATQRQGVQNERTALAWQRTALSLIVASVALARLTFPRLGLVSLISVLVAVPLCGWVLFESRSRYRQRASFHDSTSRRGGAESAALALSIVSMAGTELAALAVSP